MSLDTITPPVALLTSGDAALRQHLRLFPDETDQDALINDFCLAAVSVAEGFTRRRFLTQTVRLTQDSFGCGGLVLPIDPVISVDQVSYVDGAGVEQTMSAADYRLVRSRVPAELHPAYGESWPTPRPDRDAVSVDLVVGYGTASDVPRDIVQAVRLLVLHWYDNRDAMGSLPEAPASLLRPWRLWL
jgi:uncharacterized phiE125 gp8 family phage protein